ncbi:MAG TPA: M1 family metallopeptidase [Balneolaceae bacterium]|nr:M1 family metallopeptidase [Balneolaceae bacterium]
MSGKLFLLFILNFLYTFSISAQNGLVYESGGELIYEQAAYDVKHYKLDLKINPADSTISGHTDLSAEIVSPTNRIALDLHPDMKISRIEWLNWSDISELPFSRAGSDKKFMIHFPATLQPGENISIRIYYEGKPRVAPNPPWDGGFVWSETSAGEPWISVANQTTGAWLWWPNKDHPSDKPDSVNLHFTLPEGLKVASNGRLQEVSVKEDGWVRWSWHVSTPINNYNISVNAAPYEILTDTYQSIAGDEIEMTFWVLPEFLEQGKDLFPQFAEQLRFMEELAGPYPFRADKFGVVHTPYLGMEHQTIISYGANFEDDNLFGLNNEFDDLFQHELAHEWWGNLVSVWDWSDFWIHEGFGTYMQALYAEHLNGKREYQKTMELFRQRINSSSPVAPLRTMTTTEITEGNRGGDVYYKGAWILHTLRYLIGDDHFFESLRRFAYPDPAMEEQIDGSQVRFVTSEDYIKITEKISGIELGWFFDLYLRESELPELVHEVTDQQKLKLRWELPGDRRFPMPLDVSINGKTERIIIDGKTEIAIKQNAEVDIDPENRVLKKEKSASQQ